MIFKLSMQHQRFKLYEVYVNDDPGLTLAYLRQGQIGSPIGLNEKIVTKLSNRENLQQGLK